MILVDNLCFMFYDLFIDWDEEFVINYIIKVSVLI